MTLRIAPAPLFLGMALLAFSASALAAGVKGSAAAGKQKSATCAACHGADGNTTLDGTYPRIAGQYPDYLAKVLHDYKTGKRKNAVMAGQAQALSDQDINDLAVYYSTLPGEVHDISAGSR